MLRLQKICAIYFQGKFFACPCTEQILHLLYHPRAGIPDCPQLSKPFLTGSAVHTRLQRCNWVKRHTFHCTSRRVIRLLHTKEQCHLQLDNPQIHQECSSWGATFAHLVYPRWWVSSSGQPSSLFKSPLLHESTNLASVGVTFILLLQHVLKKALQTDKLMHLF